MDPAIAKKLVAPAEADEADDYPTPSSIGYAECLEFASASESSDSSETDEWWARPAASAPIPGYIYALTACASINAMNYGFSIGVSAGIGVFVRRDLALTDTQEGLFFSSVAFMSALGGLLSNKISDRFGRLRNLVLAQALIILGLGWCALAQSFLALLIGRFVVGISVGIGMPISPMYIAETAPAPHRGKLTTWVTLAINIGITIGFFVNWLLSDLPTGLNWRTMTLSGVVFPTVLLGLANLFMPESPRWLVLQGRASEAAEIIRRTHPVGEDVDAIVRGIAQQIEERHSHVHATARRWMRPCTKH